MEISLQEVREILAADFVRQGRADSYEDALLLADKELASDKPGDFRLICVPDHVN